MRERVALDRVHQGARFAGGRNQVVPAPRRQMAALPADTGKVGGDRIQAAEIVQKPRIDAVGLERCLHRDDIQFYGRRFRGRRLDCGGLPAHPIKYSLLGPLETSVAERGIKS